MRVEEAKILSTLKCQRRSILLKTANKHCLLPLTWYSIDDQMMDCPTILCCIVEFPQENEVLIYNSVIG